MLHDGMPCEPIQGQGQGHVTLKVRNSAIFNMYLLSRFQCELANDCQFSVLRNIHEIIVYSVLPRFHYLMSIPKNRE